MPPTPEQARQLAQGRVADAPGNWVDRWVPPAARPYFRLARLDRPIGTWLLVWPCWWSIALAGTWQHGTLGSLSMFVLFGAGALVMRGAGCTYNDLVDRDYDASVARTRSRPIPSGQVSVNAARLFVVLQGLIGFVILLQFNGFAIALGIASLGIIAIYPFMKRITYWPQLFLGFAFNWGALMGWAAVTGALHPAAFVLYGAGIAWTLGYDTIYAHQDKDDDALLGLKSTALKFGDKTRSWLAGFFALTIAGLAASGYLAGQGAPFFVGLLAAAAHLAWQVRTIDIDDPDRCLKLFRSNRDFGWLVVFAILANSWLS